MLAYSRCMRHKGVSNFPDPDSSGNLPPSVKTIATSNPHYQVAQNYCQHLLPNGSQQVTHTQVQKELAFSRCMRRHGVPNYPDPNASGQFPPRVKTIADSNPRYPAAYQTCHKLLPSGG